MKKNFRLVCFIINNEYDVNITTLFLSHNNDYRLSNIFFFCDNGVICVSAKQYQVQRKYSIKEIAFVFHKCFVFAKLVSFDLGVSIKINAFCVNKLM